MLTIEKQNTDLLNSSLPHVELSFEVIGQALPADHGYGLYSALANTFPAFHDQEWLSIQTISGKSDRQGKITLSKQSRLKIRLPYEPDKISLVLPLAGKSLTIGSHKIQLGIPQIFPLRPFEQLRARLVTIKKFQEPDPFLEAAKRQLDALGIQCHLYIPLDEQGELSRKAIKIKTYSVVGFSIHVTHLSDEDSIKLQVFGLGGKHRMGCGIFAPFPRNGRFYDV